MKRIIRETSKKEQLITKNLSTYFISNRIRVYLSVLIAASSIVIIKLPYVGYIVNQTFIIPVVAAMVFWILKVEIKARASVVLIVLGLAGVMSILNKETTVTILGNTAFFLLSTIVVDLVISLRTNEIKK